MLLKDKAAVIYGVAKENLAVGGYAEPRAIDAFDEAAMDAHFQPAIRYLARVEVSIKALDIPGEKVPSAPWSRSSYSMRTPAHRLADNRTDAMKTKTRENNQFQRRSL
jgi:hypothetical protein